MFGPEAESMMKYKVTWTKNAEHYDILLYTLLEKRSKC